MCVGVSKQISELHEAPPLWVFDARCPDPVKSWNHWAPSNSNPTMGPKWGEFIIPKASSVGSTLLIRVFQEYHTPRNKKGSREPFKLNDGISEAGIFFGSILVHWGILVDLPSFSSTNHRWNFFNDGNLQSFQPSTFTSFALCQKSKSNKISHGKSGATWAFTLGDFGRAPAWGVPHKGPSHEQRC